MKNDIQFKNKADTASRFPMSNRVTNAEKYLQEHPLPESMKSLREVLKLRLGTENEEALERMLTRVQEAVQSGAEYISENPNDSKLVAAVGEVATWVRRQANPGVKAVEDKIEDYLPSVEAWLTDVLSRKTEKN